MLPRLLVAWAAAILLAASTVTAAETWPVDRTTVPDSLEALKGLETTVKATIGLTSPYTVGLIVRDGFKSAAGSGVIVSADGLVLTAGHVSGEPGAECTVILSTGKTVKGRTLGRNKAMDSGMIRITEPGPKDGTWPHADLAPSEKLKEGQWVLTLGHPGGYRESRPPVARLGRVVAGEKSVLRTNCAIVGGDSGGPLFDLAGKLVGIHSRIGWSLSDNLHVPTDAFVKDWDQMKAGEEVGRPRKPSKALLGVEFDEASPTPKIAGVTEEYPAERAGMKAGDTILTFAGESVKSADAVRELIAKRKPGDEVVVEADRAGKTMTFKVKLAARAP